MCREKSEKTTKKDIFLLYCFTDNHKTSQIKLWTLQTSKLVITGLKHLPVALPQPAQTLPVGKVEGTFLL